MAIGDQLGELFTDEAFGAGFAARGKPGWSPGRLALVTVLQMVENLTDRQAAEAVREKISWKYALGMSLTDPGFDASVLSEFRARLIAHGLEEQVLDTLLARLGELGLVKAGGKQRTDSTHVLAAVRDLNRLELAGESVRAAVEALAVFAPGWLPMVINLGDWAQRMAPGSIPGGCPPPRSSASSWLIPTAATRSCCCARCMPPKLRTGARAACGGGPAAGVLAGELLHPHRRPPV